MWNTRSTNPLRFGWWIGAYYLISDNFITIRQNLYNSAADGRTIYFFPLSTGCICIVQPAYCWLWFHGYVVCTCGFVQPNFIDV
uniref:Uncharacterized protein n=1 Tax=uncultured marine virus TaxID=186617 RepID=A0A0F7L9W2_9VIRU|nr:hypothetical protein [uncultured marine virus]